MGRITLRSRVLADPACQFRLVPSAKGLGQSKRPSLAHRLNTSSSQHFAAKSAKPRAANRQHNHQNCAHKVMLLGLGAVWQSFLASLFTNILGKSGSPASARMYVVSKAFVKAENFVVREITSYLQGTRVWIAGDSRLGAMDYGRA